MALEVTNEIQSTASNQTVAQAKYIADDDFMTAHGTTDNKQNTINEWLAGKINEIPTPMQFKGTLGTGGTITALPTASSENEGYVYKVITAGTYQSQEAKVGDVFVSNGTEWLLIPSGDEPSGTVTNVAAQGSNGITVTGSPITTSGTLSISHSNSGVTAGTYKSVTVNATGHVTGGTNPTTLAGYGITDAINTSSTAQTKAGNLTAAKFITSGGTANQVVKGNGDLIDPATLPQYESYLQWGGKNFAGSYGCIDAAMVSRLGACRTMFAKANGIVVEYSRDGGETWLDYEATDEDKTGLFSTAAIWFYVGKSSAAGQSSANYMLRVTLHTQSQIYTLLNKFVIFISTNGSTGCYCTIRCRTQQNYEDNVDTWLTRANQVPISGWSGYNVINIVGTTTYGNVKSSQYGEWQFIFGCTGYSGNSSGLCIASIFGFGGVGWDTPSTMARTGHLYSFDSSQNATFPAKVIATDIMRATGFQKTGGTSSQFLKADGSVDNNTYSTTDTKVTTVTVAGSGNAITTGSISSDGKTLTLTKGATFLTEHQSLSNYIQKSNTTGLVKNDGSIDTTNYTTNTGTVTSVQVQATSPVLSSVNTAQTGTLNTTISLANGYGDIKNPYTAKPLHYVLAAKSTGASTDTERDVEFRQLDYTDLTGTPTALSTTAHSTSENYFVTGSGYTTTPTKFLREDGTWQTPGGSGTVTSITAGTGLDGGTITSSGTISLKTAASNVLGGVKTGYTTTNHSTKVEMEIVSGGTDPTGNIYVPIGATVKSVGVIQGDPWENDDTGIAVYRAESDTAGGVSEGQLFIHTGDLVTWLQNDSSTNRNMFLQLIYQYVQEQGGVTP